MACSSGRRSNAKKDGMQYTAAGIILAKLSLGRR